MKKWLNRIAFVLLGLGAALGCFYLIGETRLTKKIANLKAQGLPTNFAELEAYSKLPEGTANAAEIYMKAFAAYKPLADAEKQKLLPVMGCQIDPNDNEPYPAEQMAAAAEFMTLNQEMFALLHEAGKVKDCYYPITYSLDFFPNDILRNIKSASQSLCIAGIYYSQTKQPQIAYDAVVSQMRLGRSLSNNQFLINHLVRLAIQVMGISGIESIINQTSPDESQMQQFQVYLQQVGSSTHVGPVLYGEICMCLEYKNLLQGTAGVLSAEEKGAQYMVDFMPENVIELIGAYQEMIEVDKLPIQEQLPKVREIIKDADNGGRFVLMPRIILPAIEKVYMIHLRVRANMDCAITALAIERYRLKEKKLPETVEALVPGYLSQVYLDPFDGKPLRYKRTEPGYMVYTVGPDGVDDGGVEMAEGRTTYDWVFEVYR